MQIIIHFNDESKGFTPTLVLPPDDVHLRVYGVRYKDVPSKSFITIPWHRIFDVVEQSDDEQA